MLKTSEDHVFGQQIVAIANDDLGAAVAHDLWAIVDPLLACVDFSEDQSRYQLSSFRFSELQRELFAALNYLTEVEFHGHAGYFASTASFGFDEAMSCFERLGAVHVVSIMQQALATYMQSATYANGTVAIASSAELSASDRALNATNPITHLRSFSRRYANAFERW